jgi:hypothetical protein
VGSGVGWLGLTGLLGGWGSVSVEAHPTNAAPAVMVANRKNERRVNDVLFGIGWPADFINRTIGIRKFIAISSKRKTFGYSVEIVWVSPMWSKMSQNSI